MNATNIRKASYPISNIFLNRWSPRAMSGESITPEELMPLFEAARWAPSSYNGQPWRFIYAYKNSPAWEKFFDLLVPANQAWAKNAAVLVVIASKKIFDYNGEPSRTHSFDTGSAWMSLALQGSINNLVVHGMEGFDYEKARAALHIPDEFEIEAMAAIGKPADKSVLPVELQAKETPSDRKPVKDIAFENMFK